ncbi:unnamed protein product [Meganyctiphanes norvegica]|uniref:Uncharacterized protein n=1 Tax=Meganyctiphanes norvegica TaxID=48144 RepID=A0AAV2S7G6_MEGNR
MPSLLLTRLSAPKDVIWKQLLYLCIFVRKCLLSGVTPAKRDLRGSIGSFKCGYLCHCWSFGQHILADSFNQLLALHFPHMISIYPISARRLYKRLLSYRKALPGFFNASNNLLPCSSLCLAGPNEWCLC